MNILPEGIAFLKRAFHLIPALLWWALVGIVFAVLNLGLMQELWPHTPGAKQVMTGLIVVCLPLGQWGVIVAMERIRRTVRGTFWRACWSLAWLLSILGFAGLVIICLFGFAITLSS